jgi:hypothetical protein
LDQKVQIKLPGLNITLYPPKHPISQKLVRKCIPPGLQKQHLGIDQTAYAMRARVKNRTIWVLLDSYLYEHYKGPDGAQALLLKKDLETLLKKQSRFYIYRGQAYWWYSNGGKTLEEALKKGLAPEICVLLDTGHLDEEPPGP